MIKNYNEFAFLILTLKIKTIKMTLKDIVL